MRRILLTCASVAVLMLPAAASAGAAGHSGHGFLVVRKAAGDGGVSGRPVVTVVVHGFVLGRISQEAQARVEIFQIASPAGGGAPQAAGDALHSPVHWRSFKGTAYSGSGFRFRALGGDYRVVLRGSGVYLFVGGHGSVTLRGSSVYPRADGTYSLDGGTFRSLPKQPVRRQIGGG
ncbi:MAG: hypothetical protein ACJ75G_07300 [Gaiellaceae bacterium]